MQPIRVTYNQTCELLSIKRDALRLRIQKDPTFPRPYKCGSTQQAPVYFDYADLVAWHNNQKANHSEMEA
ncbi:helix-turn-helix transcriptional regulator [Acinetobacter brisouii]|uniref:helix-turn-helix transcriptional regulator n=1 Tax=Acinetobacter brisouii TaxID=396323 RepID=UPI00124E21E0|nr:transcriptional regulator [Acinetobacter brisouii]